MSGLTRRRVAGLLVWTAVAATAILAVLLIADGWAERGRVRLEAERISRLEEQVPTDAAAAEQLAAESERQTERSMARQRRNLFRGRGLLLAAVTLLAAAKWRQALDPARPPGPAPEPPLVAIGGREPARPIDRPPPPAIDLGVVDRVIGREGASREATIPILQALQTEFRYLPEPALRRVCERTEITPSEIVGVASFYAQFRRRPVGRHLVRVCHGTACHVAGIGPIMDELKRRLEIPADGDTDPGRRFTVEAVNCLGCCSLAPVLMVDDRVAGRLKPTTAVAALEPMEEAS